MPAENTPPPIPGGEGYEWRAVCSDGEDWAPEVSLWQHTRPAAAVVLRKMLSTVDPPYEGAWLERRHVGQPERVDVNLETLMSEGWKALGYDG